jgi:hypothetical protein
METVKIDYTLTPEYEQAICGSRGYHLVRNADSICIYCQADFGDAAHSFKESEPFIRTVCKIAARILFVLLLVGIGVGVMLK